MKKKPIDLLKEKSNYLGNFIDQIKKANQVFSSLVKDKEDADWGIKVFENAPQEAVKALDNSTLVDAYTADLSILKKNIPTLQINYTPVALGSAASTTTTQTLFIQISGMNQPQPTMVNQWAKTSLGDYAKLQEQRQRVANISSLLGKLDPKLSSEFIEANDNYQKALQGILEPKNAANGMRNVINHLKGELIKKTTKKQAKKSQAWLIISEELSLGAKSSNESFLLKQQKVIHESLHKDLTLITKNLESNPKSKLQSSYISWIDHLYATLNLLDPKFL